jgi:hypothetical protein
MDLETFLVYPYVLEVVTYDNVLSHAHRQLAMVRSAGR